VAGSKKQRRARPAAASRRRKFCFFCKEGIDIVDYKDYVTLRRFMSERAKIRSRRTTGTCRRHQRQVAVAIKRARELALLPYINR
jgi:small subunit ribosomal protein S18